MTTPITKEQLRRIIESADDVLSAQAGTNEDVHPESDDMIRLWDYLNDVAAPPAVVKRLARIALAAMDAEPAGWQVKKHGGDWVSIKEEEVHHYKFNEELPVREIYATQPVAIVDAEPVADVVAWHKEGEERTCDIRLRRFDVAPGPLFAVAQPVTVDNTFIPKNLDRALGVVGVALPESKEEFNFQIERWIQRLIDRVIRYADEFKEQPAPVVSDEIAVALIAAIEKEQDRLFGEDYMMDSKDCVDVIREEMERLNTCRAAMLQAGNSPVIPDAWIAVSERVPEEDGNYWGWWSESKRQGPVWFIKSDLQAQFQSSEITHWMPLPAAPQQEVKP